MLSIDEEKSLDEWIAEAGGTVDDPAWTAVVKSTSGKSNSSENHARNNKGAGASAVHGHAWAVPDRKKALLGTSVDLHDAKAIEAQALKAFKQAESNLRSARIQVESGEGALAIQQILSKRTKYESVDHTPSPLRTEKFSRYESDNPIRTERYTSFLAPVSKFNKISDLSYASARIVTVDTEMDVDGLANDLCSRYCHSDYLPMLLASGQSWVACHNVIKCLCFVHSKFYKVMDERYPRDVRFQINFIDYYNKNSIQLEVSSWIIRKRPTLQLGNSIFVNSNTRAEGLSTYIESSLQELPMDSNLVIRYMGCAAGFIALQALYLSRHKFISNTVSYGKRPCDIQLTAIAEKTETQVATLLVVEVFEVK